MKVILLKDVPKVGQRDNIKEVKDGFALNMLIPRGMAKMATPDAIKRLGARKEEKKQNLKDSHDILIKGLEKFSKNPIEIKVKANDKGHLFAGIGKKELAKAIKEESNLNVPEENILLNEPIKEVGEREVKVALGKVKKELKVVVTSE